MKEAAGEANLTVVAIILIGVIVAVVTPLINSMMTSTQKKTCCSNFGGIWEEGDCYKVDSTGKKVGNAISESEYWESSTKTCK